MITPARTYALDTTWRTLLKDLGVRPANVLRRAGLADDLLQQPSVRLPPEQYYRLWDGIEAECGDPLFPISLCESVRSESFSPPMFAALCSPNLIVAAQRIAKYKALIAPIRFGVTKSREVVTLEFAWRDAPLTPPLSMVMFELLVGVALARIGTREDVRPIEVTTAVLPSPLAPYEKFLGARVKRGPKNRVVFTAADAMRPFLTSNEPLWSAFKPSLRQRLADLDESVPTSQRIRAALLEGLPSGLATMEAIASKLALSKRTMQRRIETENTSFQQILRETRESLARHYLEKTKLPAAEIAFLLGFGEANSFYRAFRAWTGKTPEAVREARRKD